MLYTKTVETGTLDLIKKLMLDVELFKFNLVGGTALSLKLGHRKSIDIDLFADTNFDAPALANYLVNTYNATLSGVLKNGVFAFIIFGRSAYSRTPGNFVSYFQYKIGDYRPDHYLYFPKEPYRERYYNEFFNKLCEYKGYDIIHFLEFHFSAYPDQHDFLRFLHYELSDRMQMKITETKLKKLQSAFEWVQEKQQEWKESQKGIIKQEIEQGVREIFTDQPAPNPAEVEQFMQKLSAQLGDYIEKLMAETEERMSSITERLPAGRIELNNRNHEEKIIQLLILWQQVQAPPEMAKAEQLFKKFTAMDIATILHQHFDAFRDNKIPTLQKKVGEQNERLRMNHPPVKKLVEALESFFYGK